MRIIELKTPRDFDIHGNLYRSPRNQLTRKIGVHWTVALGPTDEHGPSGTVRDKSGKHWDWWMENGEVIVMPAK